MRPQLLQVPIEQYYPIVFDGLALALPIWLANLDAEAFWLGKG